MKFRSLVCVILVAVLLNLAGCRGSNTDETTTTVSGQNTTTTQRGENSTTTVNGNGGTTVNNQPTTTVPSSDATTDNTDILPTFKDTSALTMVEVSVNGLPVIVGDNRNMMRINSAGILNGNAENPMFILVTNIGEDDIYSATINATAGGKEICFNISYLPRGGSVWAESIDGYKYNQGDKFIVRNDAVIVTSTSAGVPIDRDCEGILKIYAGERNGSKGLFVENVSGKKLSKIVVKYRPISSSAGLFASPYQLVLTDFAEDAKVFKPNSYLHDADIVDVQIIY